MLVMGGRQAHKYSATDVMGPLQFLLWLFLAVLLDCFRIFPSLFLILHWPFVSFVFMGSPSSLEPLRIISLQELALSNLLLLSFHMYLPPSQQSPGLKIIYPTFKVPISLELQLKFLTNSSVVYIDTKYTRH